jgi:release factor glutamine methyltransferase
VTTSLATPTVRALLAEGIARLADAALPTARQDAEWLLAGVLGMERFALYLEPAQAVAPGLAARFRALVERRAGHEPLQHLLGFEDFRGLRLRVTPDALIPRPETEGLVEWALELLGEPQPKARRADTEMGPERSESESLIVVDVGTGSGAIACALASARPDIQVLALDTSPGALAVAADNVRALGLDGRVRLLAGDLLEPLGTAPGRFDMVVANLPYLPSAVIPTLPREVRAFEPRAALDGGPDGLQALRRLVTAAPASLGPGGWLVLEIGEDQAGALASLMGAEGFVDIAARRDLRGAERYVAGRSAAAPKVAR